MGPELHPKLKACRENRAAALEQGFARLEVEITRLEGVVGEMTDGSSPDNNPMKKPELHATIAQVVSQYPKEFEVLAGRVAAIQAQLKDAFL